MSIKGHQGHKRHKGQSFSLEIIVFVFFLLFFIIISFHFFSYLYNLKFMPKGKALSIEIANILLLSPGYPREESNETPGIAYRKNVIDYEKFLFLNQTNYTDFLHLYSYEGRITIITNTSSFQIGNISNSSRIYVNERICLLNSTPCILRVEVGEK